MFMIRSIIGLRNDTSATELAKISNGQLYLVRPGNIRSSRECIFNDAMATIRRAQIEHHFELVVTRVFENGDQELLEEDDETDDERSFLISHELEFRPGKTSEGEPNFMWRDLQGDVDEMFEFVTGEEATEAILTAFEACVYRGMYERKYKTSADAATEKDLREFIWKSPPQNPKPPLSRKKVTTTATTTADVDPHAPTLSAQEALLSVPGQLRRWLPEEFRWESEGDVQVRIYKDLSPNVGFRFWLAATRDDEDAPILAHRMTDDMNQRLSSNDNVLAWVHNSADGANRCWLLCFAAAEPFEEIHQCWARCIWETLHQVPFTKLKPVEQEYVFTSATDDVEMMDIEEEEDEVMNDLHGGEEEEEEDEEQDVRQEDDSVGFHADKRRANTKLVLGYKGDRFYVARGKKIGVFRPRDEEGRASYVTALKEFKTSKGKEFEPENFMLHEQDSKMIVMNPNDHSALYNMDIETEKIVEEWKVHDDVEVDHISPDQKFAPTTMEKTFLGVSHNGLFRIDPRLAKNKLVESQFKQYVSKNKFSGLATTASGKIAVASEKGDIRLFDAVGKNAKTALPPLGDPITGIDTTADGRWVVATTKTYLLLIDTLIGEGKNAGSLGFDKSFPADAKPIPRRLQLRAEHVAYMKDVTFTPARFNQGEGQTEKAIVTSTGPFVVAWDFEKVKKGDLYKYEIKKYEEHVAQDNFRFGDDRHIVVALDHGVLNLDKKSLRRPTRSSLGPQEAMTSRSHIVNSPY